MPHSGWDVPQWKLGAGSRDVPRWKLGAGGRYFPVIVETEDSCVRCGTGDRNRKWKYNGLSIVKVKVKI